MLADAAAAVSGTNWEAFFTALGGMLAMLIPLVIREVAHMRTKRALEATAEAIAETNGEGQAVRDALSEKTASDPNLKARLDAERDKATAKLRKPETNEGGA